ncbi:unnamed protein product, partial [Polarella glacialis]
LPGRRRCPLPLHSCHQRRSSEASSAASFLQEEEGLISHCTGQSLQGSQVLNSEPRDSSATALLSAIVACERGRQWQQAIALLLSREQADCGLLDASHFSSTISACGKGSRWELACWLLADCMPRASVAPNVVACNAAANACGLTGRWAQALAWFRELRALRLHPTVASCNTAISACSRVSRWERCLALFWEMLPLPQKPQKLHAEKPLELLLPGGQGEGSAQGNNINNNNNSNNNKSNNNIINNNNNNHINSMPKPNMATVGAVISSLERSQQSQRALQVLALCGRIGLRPDVAACNAALSACEKAQRWEKALGILEEMRAGVWGELAKPDEVSHNAVISACEKRGQWRLALGLLRSM